MKMLDQRIEKNLQQRLQNHLCRKRLARHPNPSTYFFHEGKNYLSFSSNDYLGLLDHPNIIAAGNKALSSYGMGSGSASLISGYTDSHYQFEERLAEFLGFQRVLLFSCGYMANTGVISTLFSHKDEIFADKNNHASLLDGCLQSKAKLNRYPHCKITSLEQMCAKSQNENKIIISEGVFGMDGSIAPLNEILKVAEKFHATTILDDAHGLGVLGQYGRGTLEHHHLSNKNINILTGTLGKAFGTYGAFVASSDAIIEALLQFCRTYLYTTALPPSVAAASMASLSLIQKEPWRREKIFSLVKRFQKNCSDFGISCAKTETPIQLIVVGDAQETLRLTENLFTQGIFIKPILPPTVPKNAARLRIILTAKHTEEQIDILTEKLFYALKSD